MHSPLDRTSSDARSNASSLPARVLLIESCLTTVALFDTIFRSVPAEFDNVSRSIDALRRITKTRYVFVAISTDLEPVDGISVTRLIRTYEATVGRQPLKIIGITRLRDACNYESCKKAGMDELVTRPLIQSYVEDAIKTHLNSCLKGFDAAKQCGIF